MPTSPPRPELIGLQRARPQSTPGRGIAVTCLVFTLIAVLFSVLILVRFYIVGSVLVDLV